MITQAPLSTNLQPEAVAGEPGLACPAAEERSEALQEARRLQQLLERVEAIREPIARAMVGECIQSLLTFYGDGLTRILELVNSSGAEGARVFDRLINDPSVRGLLLIHGLHPLPLSSRLQQAIAKVRPYMESHGGNLEFLGLENDVARFRLQGACKTCPASSVTMELALRRALEEYCPDLVDFEVEGGQAAPNTNHGKAASGVNGGQP